MRLSDFDYSLPSKLIAQTPAEPRDSARLLVYDRATDSISHALVSDLPELLPAPAVIIANNSKVRQSRLFGRTSTGKDIELFILHAEGNFYRCLLGGSGRPNGIISLFTNRERCSKILMQAEIIDEESGPGMKTYLAVFYGTSSVETVLEQYAELPLPPYITERVAQNTQYQTVFAKELGSAAAPTAGLHFTPELITNLSGRGISWNEVTLHVGLGTFLPLRQEEIAKNTLHVERCYISEQTAASANQGQPVIAVGTTSARTLESHIQEKRVISGWEATDIFIHPGYVFQAVDALITNFHLPKSSLLLLVAALLGNDPQSKEITKTPEEMRDQLLKIYDVAIKNDYRFFSFGDAMLIL